MSEEQDYRVDLHLIVRAPVGLSGKELRDLVENAVASQEAGVLEALKEASVQLLGSLCVDRVSTDAEGEDEVPEVVWSDPLQW